MDAGVRLVILQKDESEKQHEMRPVVTSKKGLEEHIRSITNKRVGIVHGQHI